jgi:hypothetical protein
MRGQLKMKENPVYFLWSPVTWDDMVRVLDKGNSDGPFVTFSIGKGLAEWNMVWLFCYDALSLYRGTLKSLDNMKDKMTGVGATVRAGVRLEVKNNLFGMKDMAEVVGPVKFISAFMQRPYRLSRIYQFCESEIGRPAADQVFANAVKNAPLLEARMLGEAEIGEDGVGRPISEARRQILRIERQSPNVIAFPGRRR